MTERKPRKLKDIRPDRLEMPKQSPEERVRNFDEVALGYTLEDASIECERCLMCDDPKCIAGCPVLLGSATPSLETLYNLSRTHYRHYRLEQQGQQTQAFTQVVQYRLQPGPQVVVLGQ